MNCTTTLYCIYPSYTVNTITQQYNHIHSPSSTNHPINPTCFISLYNPPSPSYLIYQTTFFLYLISYLLLYYVINQLSPSILSIQSNFYYYISSLFYLYIIFNTISHHLISFYLIHYIASILY